MILYEDKLRPVHGYEEGKADSIDAESSAEALSYKRDFLKHFIPIDARQIASRLAGDRFYVTRKYDGEYAFIIHDGGVTVTVNRSGRVRRGIPSIEEAGRLLDAAGIRRAMLGAEIYVDKGGGRRGRLNDLLAALADKKRIGTLHLAVFDLVQLDGRPWRGGYGAAWEKLHAVFGSGERVREVEMQVAGSAAEVLAIYEKWVAREHAEGLVVRGDLPVVYKIKPRHAIDAVVVGFSEGTGAEKGQVRSLLLALMPAEGRYQVIGRVGSGMVEEVRELLFDRLSRHVLSSEFIETDANLVAFRMVRPDTVIELTVGDLLYETEAGPKMNTLLEIRDGGYRIAGTVEGVKFLAPVFVRIRTDKRADAGDVRLTQIERFTRIDWQPAAIEPPPPTELPRSTLLFREVYRKTVGEKTMLQKYMIWKTNKEQTGEYAAYVLYVMNFSSQRQEPLQRQVNVSDSREQIRELLARALEKNIKSGWRKVASLSRPSGTAPGAAPTPATAARSIAGSVAGSIAGSGLKQGAGAGSKPGSTAGSVSRTKPKSVAGSSASRSRSGSGSGSTSASAPTRRREKAKGSVR
ncbi:hypothetical protein [Alistipes sp.]|uniref:ATP-dependent DNA ligase n=1 Tax=Alistipes sp. TaxID=1872444 RepID=UPI003AF176EC